MKGHRALAVVLCLLLCGCMPTVTQDEPEAVTSLPAELQQFQAEDGLLMVPQLVDRPANLPTTAFALGLRKLVEPSSPPALQPKALATLRSSPGSDGAVRRAWYLSQVEAALSVPVLDAGSLAEVRAAQQPSGWFFATRPQDVRASKDLVSLIDESSKAVEVLGTRDPSQQWRVRLRAAAESVDVEGLAPFTRWQLTRILRVTGSGASVPVLPTAAAPAPPTRIQDEEAASLDLAGHLALGGSIRRELADGWVTWMQGPRPVGLLAVVAEQLLQHGAVADADRIRAAVASRLEPLELADGSFAADGSVAGDLRATYLMLLLSRLTGHPFTDAELGRALAQYAPGPEDPATAGWARALRTRAEALATGTPGGTDATQLRWFGESDPAGARQLPALALMAVDLGVTVPRPVVADLSSMQPGPAAHAAVASWIAHGNVPAVTPTTVTAWERMVRTSSATDLREYFHAATALLVTQGVTDSTRWIVDDARTRLADHGGCRGVRFLLPERAGSPDCDLQVSTAAYLFSVAADSEEIVAEVRR